MLGQRQLWATNAAGQRSPDGNANRPHPYLAPYGYGCANPHAHHSRNSRRAYSHANPYVHGNAHHNPNSRRAYSHAHPYAHGDAHHRVRLRGIDVPDYWI